MRKFSAIFVVILALSLVMTACGGGGGSSSGSSNSIKATLSDFKFDPSEWTVPAGQSITLSLTNSGTVDHDWTLMSAPVTPPLADENAGPQIVKFKVSAGQTQSFTFTAPSKAGDYEVVCTIPGHLDAGMKGTLHVK